MKQLVCRLDPGGIRHMGASGGLTSACFPLRPTPTTAFRQRSTTSSVTMRGRWIAVATARRGGRTFRPTRKALLLSGSATLKLIADRGSDHQLQRSQRLLEQSRRARQGNGE
jgi:hypothetical protein